MPDDEVAAIHTDFDASFGEARRFVDADGATLATRVVTIGTLALPSGSVAVGDPFTGLAAMTGPNGPLPPGAYPVDVCVVTYPNHDQRVAAARLRLRDVPAKRWVEAVHGAGVDAGTAAFADGDDVGRMETQAASDALAKALAANYVHTYSTALLELDGGGGNVCAFSSGIGDGVYAAWWGLDEAGAPVALCLDFDLLTELETDNVELDVPLGRGGVSHPVLTKHAVKARVPWLASNKLHVHYQPPRHVHARWKLPDGSIQRIGGKLRTNRTDFDLTAPPQGARLILRVAVGMRRMRGV